MKHLAICLTILLGASSALSSTIQVPSSKSTIQAGISAAVNGDTVLVAAGVYVENIRFAGKRIVVKSASGPVGTTIRAANAAEAAVRFDQSEPKGAALVGFTITGGGRSGIFCSGSSPTILNNIITGNSSNYINDGGGISLKNTSGTLIKGNIICNNQAQTYGPAVHVGDNSMSSTEDTICYNIMYDNSGYWDIRSLGAVTNLHVYNNTISVSSYGGIVAGLDTRNNIVFSAPLYGIGGGTGTRYNCAFANYSDFPDPTGPGNISMDAMFVNPIAHDYRLMPSSPCIDAGDPNPVFNDSDGTRNDMGAIAYVPARLAKTLRVPSEFGTIQMAVDSSINGDTILLANGTYTGTGFRDILIERRTLVISSENGPSQTTIDCEGTIPSHHRAFVVLAAVGTHPTIQGITFMNGNATDWVSGGSVVINGGSPIVRNCIFRNNGAGTLTGALALLSAPGAIVDSCKFFDNAAPGTGPGIVYGSGPLSLTNCLFEHNSGVPVDIDLAVTVVNCVLSNNTSDGWSALHAHDGTSLTNCLLEGNRSTSLAYYAGTVSLPSGHLNVSGSTFCANSVANGRGSAITCVSNSTGTIQRSVFAAGLGGSALWSDSANSMSLSCVNLFGNELGNFVGSISGMQGQNGNISVNPLFCDTAAGDFMVKNTSPCLPANNSCGVQIGAFGLGCQNVAPAITSPVNANVDEEARLVYRGVVSDPDGPGVSWSYLSAPSWLASNADSIYGMPHYENHDTSFTVIASDGFLADTQVVAVTVLPQTPEVPTVRVERDTLNLHVISAAPQITWHYFDPTGNSPQTGFEIAVGTDNEWSYSEMWNPAPFISTDSFVNYGGLPLVKGQTYYLRLRAFNGTRWSPSKYGSFRLNTEPSVPVTVSPGQEQIAPNLPLLIIANSHDSENDGITYQFEVYGDSALTQLEWQGLTIPQMNGNDTTVYQVGTLLAEDVHNYWRVRASDGFEYSQWSPTVRFWMDAFKTAPLLHGAFFPPDQSGKPVYSLLPTIHWERAMDPDPEDTVRYKVELSLSANFSFVFTRDSILADSFKVEDPLQLGTHYWWRVTAKDKTGLTSPPLNPVPNFWTWQLGDINGSHVCDLADLSILVAYLSGGGSPITPRMSGDLNGDCRIDLADLSRLVGYLTGGGVVLIVGC